METKQKKKRKKGGQRKSRQKQHQQPGLSNDVIAFLDNEIAEYERKRNIHHSRQAGSGGKSNARSQSCLSF